MSSGLLRYFYDNKFKKCSKTDALIIHKYILHTEFLSDCGGLLRIIFKELFDVNVGKACTISGWCSPQTSIRNIIFIPLGYSSTHKESRIRSVFCVHW